VLALDPEVVVNAAMMEERVRAVKNDRVVAISDESVLRPGPRIAEGLAVMARALHPELAPK
jgi:iron complex transport system substrate-binding protein